MLRPNQHGRRIMGRVGQADTIDSGMFYSGCRMEIPTREYGLRGISKPPSELGYKLLSELYSELGISPSIYIIVIT
jgi:hypothetical protein